MWERPSSLWLSSCFKQKIWSLPPSVGALRLLASWAEDPYAESPGHGTGTQGEQKNLRTTGPDLFGALQLALYVSVLVAEYFVEI